MHLMVGTPICLWALSCIDITIESCSSEAIIPFRQPPNPFLLGDSSDRSDLRRCSNKPLARLSMCWPSLESSRNIEVKDVLHVHLESFFINDNILCSFLHMFLLFAAAWSWWWSYVVFTFMWIRNAAHDLLGVSPCQWFFVLVEPLGEVEKGFLCLDRC